MRHPQALKVINPEDFTHSQAASPAVPTGMARRRSQLVTAELTEDDAFEESRPEVDAVSAAICEPVPIRRDARLPSSSEALELARARLPQGPDPELEAAIIETLRRPISPGQGHQLGNAARERELCELFAKLDVVQAHHLGRRLDQDRSDDVLAQAFRRLVIERRQRLRAFLADARRRQVMAGR
ncbi:MAG: hypothetical protein H0T89_16850 [Deltaproteobacteria bacterium]|nr:hypothetical protein [Deltaproteobacteria bacterium]MDQ3300349.1 hypothetical protein [Myxococcota bacterium]